MLRVEAAVRKKITEKHGSDDPVASRRKAQGRKRIAKFRAKKARQAQVLNKEAPQSG
jgi:hypothetical protein